MSNNPPQIGTKDYADEVICVFFKIRLFKVVDLGLNEHSFMVLLKIRFFQTHFFKFSNKVDFESRLEKYFEKRQPVVCQKVLQIGCKVFFKKNPDDHI